MVQIFKDIYKKEEFGDGLSPGSDVYMNQNLLCFSTDLFVRRFTEYFLKPEIQGKCFHFHIATEFIAAHLYRFRLLLKITLLSLVCRVVVLIFYSLQISAFFLGGGSLNSYFKNEAAACKITRYRMASLTGFAWSKDTSVGGGVFVSQSVFTLSTATECLHMCSPFLTPAKP